MPYKRGYKKSSYKTMKKIAKSVLAKNLETKDHHVTYTNADITSNAGAHIIATSMVDIVTGSLSGERQGDKITVTSLKYDLFFNGGDTTNSIRLIFYIPKSPGDLLWQGAGGTNLAFNSSVDYNRYTVLKDFFITTNANGQDCIRKQGYISFRNKGKRLGLPVTYKGSAGTDCVKNRVMVYMVSDSLIGPNPLVNGYIRMFYKDA